MLLTIFISTHVKRVEADTEGTIDAARGVLRRLIPQYAPCFILERIAKEDGKDVFELESRGGKIILRGSDGVSVCSALNWYLRYYCRANITWSGVQLENLKKPLPPVPIKIRRVSPYKYRYINNYCSFTYSMPWWDWEQWQFFIDWMALNGINTPLAITGQESTWQKVMRYFGCSEEEVFEFLAGPVYLPFQWMGTLDGWGGPLSQYWIDSHAELQKKILDRERAVGMKPVLQGFTGHIPRVFLKKFPDSKFHTVKWAQWETVLLDPLDPMFQKIGRIFLEEQTREFGTSHLYDADTFIEMTPPSSEPEFLKNMSRGIYQAMQSVDPKAVWFLQGWTFLNKRQFWKEPQREAFLSAVPDDRLVVIDLFCEARPVWKDTNAFHGKPWIWTMIQNFGDIVKLEGDLPRMAEELEQAIVDPGSGNLVGLGMTQEGLDFNPVIFDYIFENAWRDHPADLLPWIRDYPHWRYGRSSLALERAWSRLLGGVYAQRSCYSLISYRPHPDSLGDDLGRVKLSDLAKAVGELLSLKDELEEVDTYQYDVVHFTRQVLSTLADSFYFQAMTEYQRGDLKSFRLESKRFLELLEDIDRLLLTRKEFLLGRWLEEAKRWGRNEQETRRLEWNARNVLVLWGDRNAEVHDYARKEWSGLIRGLYIPRFKLLFKKAEKAIIEEKSFDIESYEQDVRTLEEQWAEKSDIFPSKPEGNPVLTAFNLLKKYASELKPVQPPVEKTLTTGKPVKASSFFNNYEPEKAVDGNYLSGESRWQADPFPQWLEIDLEQVFSIDRVEVFLYWGGRRRHRYKIEISTDGKNWQKIAETNRVSRPFGYIHKFTHTFDPIPGRYLRVQIFDSSHKTVVNLVEVKAFAAGKSKE